MKIMNKSPFFIIIHLRTLDNIELIEVLAYMDIPYVETPTENAPKPRYGSETNSVPYTYPSPLLSCKPLDQCDSLRDNWRRVWESCVTSTSDHFSFKHIFLQQFTGLFRCLNCLCSEKLAAPIRPNANLLNVYHNYCSRVLFFC